MKQLIKQFVGLLVCCLIAGILLMPAVTFSSGAFSGELGAAVKGTNLEKTNVYTFIGTVIKTILGVLGVLLLIVIIYAGILWGIISQGDPTQIKKAKALILNSIIGLILVFASYAISSFLLTQITKAANAQ